MRAVSRRRESTAPTTAAPASVRTFVVTQVRQAPQHAWTAGVTSTARLLLDDEVLCIGEFKTVASSPDRLTGFQFGKRRIKG